MPLTFLGNIAQGAGHEDVALNGNSNYLIIANVTTNIPASTLLTLAVTCIGDDVGGVSVTITDSQGNTYTPVNTLGQSGPQKWVASNNNLTAVFIFVARVANPLQASLTPDTITAHVTEFGGIADRGAGSLFALAWDAPRSHDRVDTAQQSTSGLDTIDFSPVNFPLAVRSDVPFIHIDFDFPPDGRVLPNEIFFGVVVGYGAFTTTPNFTSFTPTDPAFTVLPPVLTDDALSTGLHGTTFPVYCVYDAKSAGIDPLAGTLTPNPAEGVNWSVPWVVTFVTLGFPLSGVDLLRSQLSQRLIVSDTDITDRCIVDRLSDQEDDSISDTSVVDDTGICSDPRLTRLPNGRLLVTYGRDGSEVIVAHSDNEILTFSSQTLASGFVLPTAEFAPTSPNDLIRHLLLLLIYDELAQTYSFAPLTLDAAGAWQGPAPTTLPVTSQPVLASPRLTPWGAWWVVHVATGGNVEILEAASLPTDLSAPSPSDFQVIATVAVAASLNEFSQVCLAWATLADSTQRPIVIVHRNGRWLASIGSPTGAAAPNAWSFCALVDLDNDMPDALPVPAGLRQRRDGVLEFCFRDDQARRAFLRCQDLAANATGTWQ